MRQAMAELDDAVHPADPLSAAEQMREATSRLREDVADIIALGAPPVVIDLR